MGCNSNYEGAYSTKTKTQNEWAKVSPMKILFMGSRRQQRNTSTLTWKMDLSTMGAARMAKMGNNFKLEGCLSNKNLKTNKKDGYFCP